MVGLLRVEGLFRVYWVGRVVRVIRGICVTKIFNFFSFFRVSRICRICRNSRISGVLRVIKVVSAVNLVYPDKEAATTNLIAHPKNAPLCTHTHAHFLPPLYPHLHPTLCTRFHPHYTHIDACSPKDALEASLPSRARDHPLAILHPFYAYTYTLYLVQVAKVRDIFRGVLPIPPCLHSLWHDDYNFFTNTCVY